VRDISYQLPKVKHTNPPSGTQLVKPSPSMRRPVDVKAQFLFLLSVSLFLFSQAASVKRSATLSSSACEKPDKSVLLGKYCRSSPLVFSLLPRCQGLCGSQKYTFTFVATVKLLCWAISSPRSQVNERRSEAGSFRTCRLSAATTAAVSLLGTLINATKRE
jgi:hypothetical protein